MARAGTQTSYRGTLRLTPATHATDLPGDREIRIVSRSVPGRTGRRRIQLDVIVTVTLSLEFPLVVWTTTGRSSPGMSGAMMVSSVALTAL